MSFGSLDAVLSLTVIELEMSALMRIASDVVSGARYLHERDPPIVALLTSTNIFIEENFRAKARSALSPPVLCAVPLSHGNRLAYLRIVSASQIKLGPEMRTEKRPLINVWYARDGHHSVTLFQCRCWDVGPVPHHHHF
jgi:hypothetical protein